MPILSIDVYRMDNVSIRPSFVERFSSRSCNRMNHDTRPFTNNGGVSMNSIFGYDTGFNHTAQNNHSLPVSFENACKPPTSFIPSILSDQDRSHILSYDVSNNLHNSLVSNGPLFSECDGYTVATNNPHYALHDSEAAPLHLSQCQLDMNPPAILNHGTRSLIKPRSKWVYALFSVIVLFVGIVLFVVVRYLFRHKKKKHTDPLRFRHESKNPLFPAKLYDLPITRQEKQQQHISVPPTHVSNAWKHESCTSLLLLFFIFFRYGSDKRGSTIFFLLQYRTGNFFFHTRRLH